MLRRTKIVATLGPATDDPKALDGIIQAGVDVVRINFSHGEPGEHRRRVEAVRNRARAHGRQVGVLAALQGPKIRIDRFNDGKVNLFEGDRFSLDAIWPANEGNRERVGLTYKELPNDVNRGDTLLLDDGRIVLWVEKVDRGEIVCKVVVGGDLSNNKGINRQGGGLSAAALTDKDRADIITAAELEADYVAVSFPRCADDIHLARRLLREAGGQGDIVAEIGDAELPAVQMTIIRLARTMNRLASTASQMMESMIENPIPTRAEVFDVANAVLDGTDAVMLSAEPAAGKHPVKAVAAMDRICREAEKQPIAMVSDHRLNTRFGRTDEAIAMAAMYTANHLGVRAIAALTESGATPLWMSRISSGIPIYALTPHV